MADNVMTVTTLDELNKLLGEYNELQDKIRERMIAYEMAKVDAVPEIFRKKLSDIDAEMLPALAHARANLAQLEQQITESFKSLGNKDYKVHSYGGWEVHWSTGRRTAKVDSVLGVSKALQKMGLTDAANMVSSVITIGEPSSSIKPKKL